MYYTGWPYPNSLTPKHLAVLPSTSTMGISFTSSSALDLWEIIDFYEQRLRSAKDAYLILRVLILIISKSILVNTKSSIRRNRHCRWNDCSSESNRSRRRQKLLQISSLQSISRQHCCFFIINKNIFANVEIHRKSLEVEVKTNRKAKRSPYIKCYS